MLPLGDSAEIRAAMRYYRRRGFPYPRLSRHEQIHIFRKLQDSVNRINRHTEPLLGGSKILTREGIGDVVLANLFHPHVWESHAVGMKSAVQSFGIDSSLEKVLRLCLKHDGTITDKNVLKFLKFVNGTQVCHNFRPAAAKAVYDHFRAENVLDMSTGYGGRLLGFLASTAKGTYVGVDPCRKTHEGNLRLAKAFKSSHRVKLVCEPFEDADIEKLGEPDFAFTSPPYYQKEIYDEYAQTQSRERYSDYGVWRTKFLFVMLEKTYHVLQRKGVLALNIADVRIDNRTYPLVADSKGLADKLGFRLIDTLSFKISGFGRGVLGAKSEPILIFRK